MRIRIKVFPSSKKEKIVPTVRHTYEVFVKEPATDNLANARVIELFKDFFPEARSVRIVLGHRKPQKTLDIDIPLTTLFE